MPESTGLRAEELPVGPVRPSDAYFGELHPELAPKIGVNCFWITSPLLFTVITTCLSGLPLAAVLVMPGALIAVPKWVLCTTRAEKQLWRSVFAGCAAGTMFLCVLASQMP